MITSVDSFKSNNFTFFCEPHDHGNEYSVSAMLYYRGVKVRYLIGRTPAHIDEKGTSPIERANALIMKFVNEFFYDMMPEPESNYISIMKLVDYKPWDVIASARQVGKPTIITLSLDEWANRQRGEIITKALTDASEKVWLSEQKCCIGDCDEPCVEADNMDNAYCEGHLYLREDS